MIGVQDGISIAVEGLARIYHIKKQRESNDQSILSLEQKINDIGIHLETLRRVQSISFVSLDRVVSEIRDYIERYRAPSTIKWGMKMLRVDKIGETIDAYNNELNEAIASTLAQMHVDVHSIVSRMHTTIETMDKKTASISEKLDVIINSNEIPQKSLFLQNTPVVKDRTTQIHERLRQWYLREDAAVVKLDVGDKMRALKVDELFVNLEIIEESKKKLQHTSLKSDEQKGFDDPFSEQHSYESVNHAKKEIKLENLFAKTPGSDEHFKVPRKILMLGRAGVGKTTLCLYQTYRWANGDLWQNEVRWMFHLELKKVANCRVLENEHKIHKILYEMIFRHFTDLFTEEQSESFWAMLLQRREPIVFLLDGYDEVSDVQHTACEALMAVAKNHPAASHLRILITSRPYARIDGEMDMVLENIGFKDENIASYVKKYFDYFHLPESHTELSNSASSSSVSQTLIQWLSERSKIRQICRTPIHLELLCSVWQLHSEQLIREDFVVSDLYALIVEKLVRRYLRKTLSEERVNLSWHQVKLFPESQEILRFLKELAYHGLKTGNIIIRSELFKSIVSSQGQSFQEKGIIQRFLSTGFLNSIGETDDDPLTKDYYFIHLSFQEYLTADYFAQYIVDGQRSKEIDQFVTEHKYDPTYQLVWAYVGGLLRENERAFKHYFNLLVKPPRDLFGMYELALLVRCGEEAKWPPYPILDALLNYLGKWTINISQLEVEKHRHAVYFLNHLTALYLACPHAMLRVRYEGSEGLFNIMMHEARDQDNLEKIKAVVDRLFNFADIGYYFAQSIQESVNAKLEGQASRLIAQAAFAYFYGLFKAISILFYAIIFILGNVPLALFLNAYKNYKLTQASATEFMAKFEFDDIRAVWRLLAQLQHPDTQVRLRLVRVIANVKFSSEVIPKVYVRLFHLFTKDNAYEVRRAAYHQLHKLFFERITHNEPLWFFNFSLQYECLLNDIFYQSSSLVEKLFSYYPDYLIQLGVDFVQQMRGILSDYPQIKKHDMDKHFSLECFKLLKKEINKKPAVLALVRETLLPILTWQYADIRDEETQNDYLTAIVSAITSLTSLDEATQFVWVIAREMKQKQLSQQKFLKTLYPLYLELIKQQPLLATPIEMSLCSGAFSTWNCHDDMKNFILFVNDNNQRLDDGVSLETGIVLEEIKAFDHPYVENKIITAVVPKNEQVENSTHAQDNIAAVLKHEEVMGIETIIHTLSSLIFVDVEKISYALRSINLADMTQKNKDDLMVALLRCANQVRNHRYGFYYVPRIVVGHFILLLMLSFVMISISCLASADQGTSFPDTVACAGYFYVLFGENKISSFTIDSVLFTSAMYYLTLFVLNVSLSLARNMLNSSYTGDWEGAVDNNAVSFWSNTVLFDFFNLITLNLLDTVLYLLTAGFSSEKTLQRYTSILLHVMRFIHEEALFVSLLKAYPNYFSSQSQAIFYCVLRDKLALSTTAITHEGFNHFTWYKSREKIIFESAHPLRLMRDIKSVRLLFSYFGWLITLFQPSCKRQEKKELTYQVMDDEESLRLESRESFWNYFNASQKSLDKPSVELVDNPLNSGMHL